MTGRESEASQGLARDWLWLAIVLGACAGVVAALGARLAATDALLVGFDVGCVTYLVLTGRRAPDTGRKFTELPCESCWSKTKRPCARPWPRA